MAMADQDGRESFVQTIHDASDINTRGGTFRVYTYARREFPNYERQIRGELTTAPAFQQLHFRESWLLRDDRGASVASINDASRIICTVFQTLNNREGNLRHTFLPSNDDYTLEPDKKVLHQFFQHTAILEDASKLGEVVFLPQRPEAEQAVLSEELIDEAAAARISSVSIEPPFPLALLQPFSDNRNLREVKIEIRDGDEMTIKRNASILLACKDKQFDVHAVVEINVWVTETWRRYVKCINDAKESIKSIEFTKTMESFFSVWNNDKAAAILVNNLDFVADQKVILNSNLPIRDESSAIIDGIVGSSGILVIAAEHETTIPTVLKRSLLSESCRVKSLTVEGLQEEIDNTFFIENLPKFKSLRALRIKFFSPSYATSEDIRNTKWKVMTALYENETLTDDFRWDDKQNVFHLSATDKGFLRAVIQRNKTRTENGTLGHLLLVCMGLPALQSELEASLAREADAEQVSARQPVQEQQVPSRSGKGHERNSCKNGRVVAEQRAAVESDKIALTFLYKTIRKYPEKFVAALAAARKAVERGVLGAGRDHSNEDNSPEQDSSQEQQGGASVRGNGRRERTEEVEPNPDHSAAKRHKTGT